VLGTDPLARSLEAQFRELSGIRPVGWSEFRPGLFAGVTTAPVHALNGVIVFDATRADPDYLREAMDRVAAEGYPHALTVRGAAAPRIGELAARLGLAAVDDIPVMTLEHPGDLAIDLPPGLSIRRLEREHAHEHFELTEEIFAMPEGSMAVMCPEDAFALAWVNAYIGEVDGEVVCTAMSYMTQGVVWIYDVATLDQHRGRGYGGAITARAISQAAAGGAQMAALQTSEDGFPVYRRLGFEVVESWTRWTSSG
jgi:GNAT superfamily N-acetyltransferase